MSIISHGHSSDKESGGADPRVAKLRNGLPQCLLYSFTAPTLSPNLDG
jgi:hypothetical protein